MSLKISIITVCYNSSKTINDTLSSVAIQNYPNIEHIIIDGNSSDHTLEIVNKYPHVSKVVNEDDDGIYDAMNKGIMLASGDIIGTLNADDLYIDANVISTVMKSFEAEAVDAVYADLYYVDEQNTNKIVRFWKSRAFKKDLFKSGWMPAHPTFFVRNRIYKQYGLFDLSYKLAADFELLFRFLELKAIKTSYIPRVFVKMRLGGATNKNISNIIQQNTEMIRLLKMHFQDFSIFKFLFSKIFNRLQQFFLRN